MSISHLLEDFSLFEGGAANARLISEDGLEDHRLAAFEKGYAAGWEDAVAARNGERSQVVETLSHNLEDISFTYQEAFRQMVAGVEPVFRSLVNSVLPRIMQDVIGERIVEAITDMTREHSVGPACITVPPGAAEALEPVLERDFAMPVRIVEDASVGPGQIRVSVGANESELDGDRLMATIGEAIEGFLHEYKKEADHA